MSTFFLLRQVAELASALFYCWSLLRNNNMATNLQRLLQITVKGVLPHATVECRHLGYSGIAHNFILCEKKHGEFVAMLPQV